MAQAKYKPLSFTTTLRNPERIPAFLKCLLPFEGKKLTSGIIHEVVKSVIKNKIYKPMGITRSNSLNAIWNDSDITYSDDQLEAIIRDNPQRHKEFGFKEGWDSRFDTWYKIMKEFGFANYSMDQPIKITQTGHMLIDAYSEVPSNNSKIQKVYLNAFMKYQSNNPLRKTLNENAPLPLLLNVIRRFQQDSEENGAGLARHELPILICWTNNDADAVYRYIKNIRKKSGYNCSDEYIYERCLEILQSDNRKYYKMDKICHESVDEYIRKMRMSGLLSLRGNGRFLDINKFEDTAVDYVIGHYSFYIKYEEIDDYIAYTGTIDTEILDIKETDTSETDSVKQTKLKYYASVFDKNYIFNELRIVCSRKNESKDGLLKYIPAPTRLEFLTSIALLQNFEGIYVKPNYSIDDEGLPTSTAAGGLADIECFDDECDSYYEVTLLCNRTSQVNNEIIPIGRHLKTAIEERRENSFAVFVAPVIHSDTVEACDWQNFKYKLNIIPYNIEEFIKALSENSKTKQFLIKS